MIYVRTPSPLETELMEELGRIERKIADLQKEKLTVERMVNRLRREKVIQSDATRSNSFRRVIVENKILEILSDGNIYSTKSVYGAIKFEYLGLKSTTFRSYLHRMRLRGLIEPNGYGRWMLPGKPVSAELIAFPSPSGKQIEGAIRPSQSSRPEKGR